MKLYVNLGVEERAVKFASKAACRRSLNNAMAKRRVKRKENQGILGWHWKGRKYAYCELLHATIQTVSEHWNNSL